MALALVTQLLLLIEEPSSISDVLFNETEKSCFGPECDSYSTGLPICIALLFRSFHYELCTIVFQLSLSLSLSLHGSSYLCLTIAKLTETQLHPCVLYGAVHVM